MTLSLDPEISRRAKKLAHLRQTSVSALVDRLLGTMPLEPGRAGGAFVERWAGKFRMAGSRPGDVRMKALEAKYRLKDL